MSAEPVREFTPAEANGARDAATRCRMCGAECAPSSDACPACGERFVADGAPAPIAPSGRRLGGWLVVAGIALLLTLLGQVVGIIEAAVAVADGTKGRFEHEFPIALALHVVFGGATFWVASRFFGRRREAPLLVIALYCANAAMKFVLALLADASIPLYGEGSAARVEFVPEVAPAGLVALAALFYFEMSRRVRETFVN